jgi:hypothetical protein
MTTPSDPKTGQVPYSRSSLCAVVIETLNAAKDQCPLHLQITNP